MWGEDDNISDNFRPHLDKESILCEQDIEGDHRNMVGQSGDTRSCVRKAC